MKKAIIAIVAVLFLCVVCCVVMFFAARSIPSITDALPQDIKNLIQTGMETGSGSTKDDQDATNDSEDTSNNDTNDTNNDVIDWESNTGNKTWPSDMPSVIPQFRYGTIDDVSWFSSTGGKTWTIVFVNVEDGAYENYQNDLKAKGFSDLFNFETGEGWSITGQLDDVSFLSFYDNADGTYSITITKGYNQ